MARHRRSAWGIVAYSLLAFLATAPATGAVSEPEPIWVGTWECELGTFVFTRKTYDYGSGKLKIRSVEERENDFTFSFDDDYRISLFEVSVGSMIWHSLETGDTFPCRRLAN